MQITQKSPKFIPVEVKLTSPEEVAYFIRMFNHTRITTESVGMRQFCEQLQDFFKTKYKE